MAKHAYSASYDLGNKEIFQRLYLFSNSDQAEMACWLTNMLIQLTNTKLLDFTCRVVGGGHQLKVGIYINGESISLLNDFNESAHNGHTNSDYVVKTKEEFDEFYFDTESSNIQRVQNIHNAQQVPLISHINLFDLLGLLISDQQHWKFPFAIQFNIEHLTNLTEIQRATRKWLVKLDFDNLIPTQLKESLKRSAEININASMQVDTLLSFPENQHEVVLQTINDLYYQSISNFGFKTVPFKQDDLANDLFHSALALSHIESSNELEGLSRAFNLDDLLNNLSLIQSDQVINRVKSTNLRKTYDVFVSYSSKNFNQATAVCHGIENNNIRCWMAPRDIKPGESYASSIVKGIEDCKIFLLVFSDASNASQHVLREVERAVNLNKIIVPFKIEESELDPNLAYFISICHWLDAVTPPLKSHIDELIDTLKKQIS